jgi:hypothetical protein
MERTRRWRRELCAAVLAALAAAAPAAAQAPKPGEGSTRARIEPRPAARTAEFPTFEFRSSFWVNLHHFLYEQARLGRAAETEAGEADELPDQGGSPAAAEPARFVPEDASAAAAWNLALEQYRAGVARRDLRLAFELVAIKNRLAELDGCGDLSGRERRECTSGLRPELIEALEAAAPVYRAGRWAADDRHNREWIAAVEPLAGRFGRALGARLARVYQEGWPAEPIRVDVVVYAARSGSYSTLEPVHVVIASTDERNRHPAALEVLFHEASHALAGGVADGIARRCRALNKPIPRDLWHALIYYTTGDAVRRAMAESETYLPYGHRFGLYARGWRRYLTLLEDYWQPYLDGRTTQDRALSRLVAAL